jgi:hypothetical protein
VSDRFSATTSEHLLHREGVEKVLPSSSLRERLSGFRGIVTLVFVLTVATLAVVFDRPVPPSLALLAGMIVFLLGSTVGVVRSHPLYDPFAATYTTLLFGSPTSLRARMPPSCCC